MRPLIIAELSGNHGGDLLKAKELIRAAAGCGCDLAKIQLYEPEDMDDLANNAIYEKCKIPREWLPDLFATAKSFGIPLFSSVFGTWAIKELEQFDCWGYKIASPESTRLSDARYLELTRAIGLSEKRFIMSSGRSDMTWAQSLLPDLLFYCVAGYPATVTGDDIQYLADIGGLGFSDHTDDIVAPLAMLRAGAVAIEKHFKLDDDCIDTAFSLNPAQMQALCRIAHR